MQQAVEILDREAEEIVKHISIPPCPEILTRLVREMNDDDPDFAKIGKLISGDVSLAAALLKTVNSPFYGLRSKATSVQQALALLGLRNVAQLVSGLLLRQAFNAGSNAQMEEYWESSSGIAPLGAALARHVAGIDRDEAYTFALFRDCGILAMINNFPDYKPGTHARGSAQTQAIAVEDERYGINHARLGHLLAMSWLLPLDICLAVRWHHDYAAVEDGRAEIPAASAKHIALGLAAEWAYSRQAIGVKCPEWATGGEFALRTLGMTQEQLEEYAAEIVNAR